MHPECFSILFRELRAMCPEDPHLGQRQDNRWTKSNVSRRSIPGSWRSQPTARLYESSPLGCNNCDACTQILPYFCCCLVGCSRSAWWWFDQDFPLNTCVSIQHIQLQRSEICILFNRETASGINSCFSQHFTSVLLSKS
jgi:hypothetical protein